MIAGETVAKTSTRNSTANRRASPEAVEKRRAARAFNEAVLGPTPRAGDGRTERRRRRLLKELASGTTSSGHDLKPIEVLLRVQALLDLGETAASIEQAVTPPPPVPPSDALVERVRRLHQAYGFAPETYRFAGVGEETLSLAGIRRRPRGPVKAPARPATGVARRGAA